MSGYRPEDDDPLAYGEDYGSRGPPSQRGTDRGIVGSTFRKLKSQYDQHQNQNQSKPNYGYTSGPSGQQHYGQPSGYGSGYAPYSTPGQPAYPGGPPAQAPQPKPDVGTRLFGALHSTVHSIGSDVAGLLGTQYNGQAAAGYGSQSQSQSTSDGQANTKNRYDSFASEKNGNDVKWYVDGCGYMWAVSKAIEGARESIWILDWWLTPELYLRRPPSKNEEWRLDRVIQRAAQRGVKVNIIVYKEVTQALTRTLISPTLPSYLHSLLPKSTDWATSWLVRMGLEVTAASLEYVESTNPLIEPPLTVSSAHTKHALENLSPNIAVFRHPDHLPDAQTTQSSLMSSLQGLKLDAAGASKLGTGALKGLYGLSDDVILYWAHHEKLCLIDGQIAFMGGLDLCFGRWDTNHHSIADAHGGDMQEIVFPGQDYNNARYRALIHIQSTLSRMLADSDVSELWISTTSRNPSRTS